LGAGAHDQLSHDVLLDGGYRGSVVSFGAASSSAKFE
jgi:hypothetical protein